MGHFEIVKYIIEEFNLTERDDRAIELARTGGYEEIEQWLIERFRSS